MRKLFVTAALILVNPYTWAQSGSNNGCNLNAASALEFIYEGTGADNSESLIINGDPSNPLSQIITSSFEGKRFTAPGRPFLSLLGRSLNLRYQSVHISVTVPEAQLQSSERTGVAPSIEIPPGTTFTATRDPEKGSLQLQVDGLHFSVECKVRGTKNIRDCSQSGKLELISRKPKGCVRIDIPADVTVACETEDLRLATGLVPSCGRSDENQIRIDNEG